MQVSHRLLHDEATPSLRSKESERELPSRAFRRGLGRRGESQLARGLARVKSIGPNGADLSHCRRRDGSIPARPPRQARMSCLIRGTLAQDAVGRQTAERAQSSEKARPRNEIGRSDPPADANQSVQHRRGSGIRFHGDRRIQWLFCEASIPPRRRRDEGNLGFWRMGTRAMDGIAHDEAIHLHLPFSHANLRNVSTARRRHTGDGVPRARRRSQCRPGPGPVQDAVILL